jgi:hypothetical protein
VSNKAAPCPLDHVNRQFHASAPNRLWVSDFTYVATWTGFVYVAFVIDTYARRIVGWRVSRTAHASFVLDALPRRVVAKVEWHPGELYPRVGFIVTNMARVAENVVGFYNKRGTCEQWIKEGKGAIKWTRLSCRSFAANAVRLQLHALAYNLGNFLRTLATPEPIKDWSLTSLKEKLIKIGAKVVSHGCYVAFQMAEVAFPQTLFADILQMIGDLRPPPVTSTA